MAKRFLFALMAGSVFLLGLVHGAAAQEGETSIRVEVDMVQLNVAVMDSKGNYVTGLKPSDFEVTEDGIPQKVATFGEGNEATRRVTAKADEDQPGQMRVRSSNGASDSAETTSELGSELGSAMAGANVFILFDTSNYMYRGFVFAQDAIAEFVRSLDNPDRVAFYSYSRDLSRATTLTPDRNLVLRGVRTTVAGDDAALYNSLLLTVKDAAQYQGRKVIVVFSNGPDNASVIAPDDVRAVAEDEGAPAEHGPPARDPTIVVHGVSHARERARGRGGGDRREDRRNVSGGPGAVEQDRRIRVVVRHRSHRPARVVDSVHHRVADQPGAEVLHALDAETNRAPYPGPIVRAAHDRAGRVDGVRVADGVQGSEEANRLPKLDDTVGVGAIRAVARHVRRCLPALVDSVSKAPGRPGGRLGDTEVDQRIPRRLHHPAQHGVIEDAS